MARVLGIGGIFVKSDDDEALKRWYREVLGFDVSDWGRRGLPARKRGLHALVVVSAIVVAFRPVGGALHD